MLETYSEQQLQTLVGYEVKDSAINHPSRGRGPH
jgi:hypothetical protein